MNRITDLAELITKEAHRPANNYFATFTGAGDIQRMAFAIDNAWVPTIDLDGGDVHHLVILGTLSAFGMEFEEAEAFALVITEAFTIYDNTDDICRHITETLEGAY